MRHRNNLLVGFIIIGALFLAAIPMSWYTLGITLTGRNGGLGFGDLPKLPIWFLLGVSAAAVAVLSLNTAEITSVPRWVMLLALNACGAFYLLPIFFTEKAISFGQYVYSKPEVGPFVALGATLAAILLETVYGRNGRPVGEGSSTAACSADAPRVDIS